MACPRFPQGKLQEIIASTVETGKEHGFVKCADGSTSDIISGGPTGMDIGEGVEQCNINDGPVEIVHTHPNGIDQLSKQDRQVAAQNEVGSVCVAVEGGSVRCESVETCKREVDT